MDRAQHSSLHGAEAAQLELARSLSSQVPGRAAHERSELPVGAPGRLPCAASSHAPQALRAGKPGCVVGAFQAARPEPGSTVFPALSTETLHVMPVDKGKLFKRLRSIFREHAKRENLELTGSVSTANTATEKYR